MSAEAQINVTDQRRTQRHPVDHQVVVEHFDHGDMSMHIANISANGFMIDDANNLARGDRVIVRLAGAGRIEAYCIWHRDCRAGFQFERIIRPDDFMTLLGTFQPNPRLRQLR